MKRGIANGPKACCTSKFGMWGFSLNCPNPVPSEHSTEPVNDPGTRAWILEAFGAQVNRLVSRGFAYNARGWQSIYQQTATKEILPQLWDDPATGRRDWSLHGAKLPTSYPYGECDKYPPISSATDGGDDTWDAGLGLGLEIAETDTGEDETQLDFGKGFVWGMRTRNIFTDGENTHVAFMTNGRNYDADGLDIGFNMETGSTPPRLAFGDTWIASVHDPSAVVSYNTAKLGRATVSSMEGNWTSLPVYLSNALDAPLLGSLQTTQPACNSVYHGLGYAGYTTYTPDFAWGQIHGTGAIGWVAARLLYDGQRPVSTEPTDGTEPGLEVFVSPRPPDEEPDLGCANTTYDGTYIVVMFAVRCYLERAAITEEDPNEPFVIAIHKDVNVGTTKIIAGQWNSKRYRPGVGSEDDWTGAADGTLSDAEADAAQVIMDAAAPPDGYEGTFPTPRIWCYNRCWDAVAKQNVHLALITTEEESVATTIDDVISGFEQPGTPDPTYLDDGLSDAGLHWKTGGLNPGDGWQSDIWSEDGGAPYTGDSGSRSARSREADVTKRNDIDLSITFTMPSAGDFKFRYLHDNRKYGSREAPWVALSNEPEVDNTFGVYVDGGLIKADAGTFLIEGVAADSLIDNVNYPTGWDNTQDFFVTWRQVTISLQPGTHTIRFRYHREWQDNGHSYSAIDDVQFPEVMVGNDINGLKRWWFDGYELHELTDWTWAERDIEDATPVADRASTVPWYITMDGSGRYLIGNQHYIIRMLRDGTLDKSHGKTRGSGFDESTGYVRFTASANIEQPPPSCLDPNDLYQGDMISDTRWGGMQILPVGKDTYQVRGANASLDRDATRWPFDAELWKFKHPVSGKENHEVFINTCQVRRSGRWNERCTGWVVSDNGTDLTPMIETLWRPTMHQPAWPAEGEDSDPDSVKFPHPPYTSDFGSSKLSTEWAPDAVRWRDPYRVQPIVLVSGTLLAVDGGSDLTISAGSTVDGTYVGDFIRTETSVPESVSIASYSYDPDTDTRHVTAFFDTPPMPGEDFSIYIQPPRWTPNNLVIPRTGSDALSRRPQPVWVRIRTSPPPDVDSETHDINWWDPDSDHAYIAGRQDPTNDPPIIPAGGPWGDALWVLVQARFSCTGLQHVYYMHNNSTVEACSGHGADEEDDAGEPNKIISDIQRMEFGGDNNLGTMSDYDAIPCDCDCCAGVKVKPFRNPSSTLTDETGGSLTTEDGVPLGI